MKVHVIHENPDWYVPLAVALRAEGVPHEQWLLDEGLLDLGSPPPPGVFWSRMSASSHTRGHLLAKDYTRAVLCWLEAHGRRVVNGRRALELEMSKVDQLTALRAAGFDVPRTLAVAGRAELLAAAHKLPVPFVTKHNQGGKGLGVRRFDSHDAFAAYVSGREYVPAVDGITLLQEYVQAAQPFITRVEVVGGEFVYAVSADTSHGGFELCPADACSTGVSQPAAWPAFARPSSAHPGPAEPVAAEPGLFTLREGFDHPIIGRYLHFARLHGIDVAGFEFIETADGRMVTYDVNTTTNYNSAVEAAAELPAMRAVARFLGRLLAPDTGKGSD